MQKITPEEYLPALQFVPYPFSVEADTLNLNNNHPNGALKICPKLVFNSSPVYQAQFFQGGLGRTPGIHSHLTSEASSVTGSGCSRKIFHQKEAV